MTKHTNLLGLYLLLLMAFFLSAVLMFSFANVSHAEEKNGQEGQWSSLIEVSESNMAGQPGWYFCNKNCEAWGLKKGEWHRHLTAFSFETHAPIGVVRKEVVTSVQKVPLDKEVFYKKGYESGYKIGFQDGYEQHVYKGEEAKEMQEDMLRGYKDGYKKGYEDGKAKKIADQNQATLTIFDKGKEDGFHAYKYGAKKKYHELQDASYDIVQLYQKGFDEGWKKGEEAFFENYPLIHFVEIRVAGIRLPYLVGVGLLLFGLLLQKAKKDRQLKLEQKIYQKESFVEKKEDSKKTKDKKGKSK